MGQIGAACIAMTVILLVVIHAAIIRLALRMFEYAPPFNADDSAASPFTEPIRVITTDGVVLVGCVYRRQTAQPKGLIVFSHELGAGRWSAMSYCEGLLKAGFDVLAFDFRSHGDSGRVSGYAPIHWLTTGEILDLEAVLRFIQSRDDLKMLPLGLYGISRGGCASLAVAAHHREVQCVCADSSFTTHSMARLYAQRWLTLVVPAWAAVRVPAWHIEFTITAARWISQFRRRCRYVSLEKSLGKLRGRSVSLITGKRDTYVLPEIAKHIYDCIGGDEVTLWIVPGAKHNMARSIVSEEYDGRLVEFFEQMTLDLDSEFECINSSQPDVSTKPLR